MGRCRGKAENEPCDNGMSDHTCDLGLQGMQVYGTNGILYGKCKPLIKAMNYCQIIDPDNTYREYSCEVGYKCSLRTRSDSIKRCYPYYVYPDGEISTDSDLCQGGNIVGSTCVSLKAVRVGGQSS